MNLYFDNKSPKNKQLILTHLIKILEILCLKINRHIEITNKNTNTLNRLIFGSPFMYINL